LNFGLFLSTPHNKRAQKAFSDVQAKPVLSSEFLTIIYVTHRKIKEKKKCDLFLSSGVLMERA